MGISDFRVAFVTEEASVAHKSLFHGSNEEDFFDLIEFILCQIPEVNSFSTPVWADCLYIIANTTQLLLILGDRKKIYVCRSNWINFAISTKSVLQLPSGTSFLLLR